MIIPNDTGITSLLGKIFYRLIFFLGTIVLMYFIYHTFKTYGNSGAPIRIASLSISLLIILGSVFGFFYNKPLLRKYEFIIASLIILLTTILLLTDNLDELWLIGGGSIILTLFGFYYGRACKWIIS